MSRFLLRKNDEIRLVCSLRERSPGVLRTHVPRFVPERTIDVIDFISLSVTCKFVQESRTGSFELDVERVVKEGKRRGRWRTHT